MATLKAVLTWIRNAHGSVVEWIKAYPGATFWLVFILSVLGLTGWLR